MNDRGKDVFKDRAESLRKSLYKGFCLKSFQSIVSISPGFEYPLTIDNVPVTGLLLCNKKVQ